MMEFYPRIREVHILAAVFSGSLFALRGACAIAGMRWPRSAPVRYLGYTVDATLLTAALMLVTILPSGMFANHWLTVKLCFVAAYVALGIATMRAPRRGLQAGSYVAALLAFALVVGIARAHHPLGWFVRWLA
ncbi:MAG: SirB2 family protein [Thermomonas sp.]